MVRGRKEEAVATLKSIGTVNINSSFSDLMAFEEKEEEISTNLNLFSAMQRLSAVMTVGFGVGMGSRWRWETCHSISTGTSHSMPYQSCPPH